MRSGLANAVAALAALSLCVWLWGHKPDRSVGASNAPPGNVEETAASALPCTVPLAWRIARVDPRFAVDADTVRNAVMRAAAIWEGIAGRTLFVHDPRLGFPIRLSYDERQQDADDRRSAERALNASLDSLAVPRAALADLEARAEDDRARFDQEERTFTELLAVHNDSVRAWNARGGAPPGPAAALLAEAEALDFRRGELQTRHASLNARLSELAAARNALAERVLSVEAQARQAERRYGLVAAEGARYTEVVVAREGRQAVLEREVRVWRFDDVADLERVVAHELGHALGLGHTAEDGSLMSARHHYAGRPRGALATRPEDDALLQARCPGWFGPRDETLAVGDRQGIR